MARRGDRIPFHQLTLQFGDRVASSLLTILLATTAGRFCRVPVSFGAMLIVAMTMGFMLQKSVFERHRYAVGKNVEAACLAEQFL